MDNKSIDKKYILNFDFIIPKELSSNFQGIFSYIKKKYQIKFSRKSHIDSLLKKCKGKFFKAIHEIMNLSLNIMVKRLPQKFITNITIEYNQKFMEKNVIELYKEFNILPDYQTLIEKNLIKLDKKDLFAEFCGYSLFNLYNVYRESQRFSKEINDVKNHDGKRNGILYEFVSTNFCAYYEYSKPHSLKLKENKDNNLVNHNIINPNNNADTDKYSNNNKIIDNNNENKNEEEEENTKKEIEGRDNKQTKVHIIINRRKDAKFNIPQSIKNKVHKKIKFRDNNNNFYS